MLLCRHHAFSTCVKMERFKSKLFIEVEKRPVIWDMQKADYSNKIAQNGPWQELVNVFGDGEDPLVKILKTINILLNKNEK